MVAMALAARCASRSNRLSRWSSSCARSRFPLLTLYAFRFARRFWLVICEIHSIVNAETAAS
jgi:hypothetical protein